MKIAATLPYYIYSNQLVFKQAAEAPPPETSIHYDSTAAAVRELLDDSDPRVIAFGEFHPCRGENFKTAMAYFSDEVLQILKDEGITDLVVERILNDPAIIAELDAFYNDKTLIIGPQTTPTLWHTFEYYSDKDDLILLLNKARALGIRVIPGGMTHAQADQTIHVSNWNRNYELILKAWQYAEAAIRTAVQQLLDANQNTRVAIYGGVKHHHLISARITEAEGGTNYGEHFSQSLGQDYMEVELYPADGLRYLSIYMQDYVGVPNWRELAPESGVNRLDRGQSHILIIR